MAAPHISTLEISAQLQWVFYRDECTRRWIAVCEALKVTVEADTHTELRENIEDGLNLLFRSLLRDRELDRFLQMRGWTMLGEPPDDTEDVRFDVPIELIARDANGSAPRVH